MFFPGKKSKTAPKLSENGDEPLPIDVLVDVIIGFLEKSTAYMRAMANQAFALLCGSVQEPTIDLIVEVGLPIFADITLT